MMMMMMIDDNDGVRDINNMQMYIMMYRSG